MNTPEFNLQNPNKEFIYFSKSTTNYNNDNDDGNSLEGNEQQQQNSELLDSNNIKNRNELLKRFFPDILKALGDRAIKENTLSLRELEQHLQNHIQDLMTKRNYNTFLQKNMFNKNINSNASNNSNESDATTSKYDNNPHYQQQHQQQMQQKSFRLNFNFKNNSPQSTSDLPIVSSLIERGYLVDSKNWLKKKGFLRVGQEILSEIIKSLKADKLGMHETHFSGSSGGGNIMQENSKKYEFGNELSNININSTIMNIIDRKLKKINNNNINNPNNYNKQYQEIPSSSSSSSSSSSLLSIE